MCLVIEDRGDPPPVFLDPVLDGLWVVMPQGRELPDRDQQAGWSGAIGQVRLHQEAPVRDETRSVRWIERRGWIALDSIGETAGRSTGGCPASSSRGIRSRSSSSMWFRSEVSRPMIA
jgi:hypothetical protein